MIPTQEQRAASAADHAKRYSGPYIVRDAKSREDFRCASAGKARAMALRLTANGRHVYVSPPLPALAATP